jgi:alcohol dehydrogenase class IV
MDANARDGIVWIESLCTSFDMPKLSDFGITQGSFQEIVSRSKKASSMKGNPVPLNDNDITEVLQKAISQ